MGTATIHYFEPAVLIALYHFGLSIKCTLYSVQWDTGADRFLKIDL